MSALPASSESTTWSWDVVKCEGTFGWDANSYNSTQLFGEGDYSSYTTLNIVTSDGTADHFRIIIKYYNGAVGDKGEKLTTQVTYYTDCGVKSLSWSTIGLDVKYLPDIQTIRLSGAGDVDKGNIKVSKIYLEGPDPSTYPVYALGDAITFEEALVASDPFVLVQNGKVMCGPLSPSDNSLTFKDVTDITDYSWTFHFEEDATNTGSYFMELRNSNDESKGYVNASVWSHTYLSGIDKAGTKGELQDGALWTITSTGGGKYSIKNLGVTEGNYNDKPSGSEGDRAAAGQGYLGITTGGYWANHVTFYNTSGEWEFRTLTTTSLPANDPVFYGWDELTVTKDAKVTKDDEKHLVVDTRDYAAYWAETASWKFASPVDATNYRYLVFYAKRNVSKYGNGDNDTGGTLFVKDNSGVSFRQDDYTKYNEKNYPDVPTGSLWMNKWDVQRATVLDLQWLANTDKYGDGSDCKSIDITKITEIGVAGTFTIGGIFFTNTLPAYSAGDYTRSISSFDKFGTVCLPYSAVCCGAQLYEIVGQETSNITLEEYEGVMEPGKAYFYKTLEAKKGSSLIDETDVYFFKAGYKKVDSPEENNGLVGTFEGMTLNSTYYSDDILVLSDNQLWKVNSDISVGANKAYINKNLVPSGGSSLARGIRLSIGGADITEVKDVKEVIAAKRIDGKFYDLMGREATRPVKGQMYIYNGKTIVF